MTDKPVEETPNAPHEREEATSWEDLFEGQTPQQVRELLNEAQDKVEKWKSHSRTWENRATKSNKEVDHLTGKLQELESREVADPAELSDLKEKFAAQDHELALWRTLTQLGVDVPRIMDSRAFMDRVRGLDPHGEDFTDQVKDAISAAPAVRGVVFEDPADHANTADVLWERLHGRKQKKGSH